MLGLVLACAAAAQPATAAAIEPTADEVLLVVLANRLRADPPGEGRRLAPPGRDRDASLPGVDLGAFRAEMAAIRPAPALVIAPALTLAARRHAAYLARHWRGDRASAHREAPDAPGFTGITSLDRALAAGHPARMAGENVAWGRFAAPGIHAGLVIDYDLGGGAPDGMQPGRGHRANLANPAFREIGVGIIGSGHGQLAVQAFASRAAGRLVGGVVYADADGDGAYDPGEGRGGVEIAAADGSATRTWAAGAFTLELAGGAGAVRVVASAGGATQGWTIAADERTAWREWRLDADADAAQARRLLAALAAAPTPLRARAAAAAIALAADQLQPGPELAAALAAAAAPLAAEIAADRAAVLAAWDDPDALARELDRCRRAWSGTAAAAWFADAPVVREAEAAFARFAEAAERGPIPDARHARADEALRAARRRIASAYWRERIERLREALDQYRPDPAPGRPRNGFFIP